MAGGIPPPPTKAESGDFLWIDWYNKLNNLLNTTGSVGWNLINFSGSSLGDLQTRNHEQLNAIQGGTTGEHYHLTQAQWSAYTNPFVNNMISQSSDPTTSQLTASKYNVYKNTTTNVVKLWVNDGGTLKSVTLV